MFNSHYIKWQQTRINKIVSIFGKDFLKEASVLELGCGLGHIGKHLHDLDARVTLAEGRKAHVEKMKSMYPSSIEIILLNQEEAWNLNKQFDLVLHMGVLYHLKNWEQDLKCALAHTANAMVLETVVTTGETVTVKETSGYDQAISREGSRIRTADIETILKQKHGKYKRYDDPALNAHPHCYDWEENTITTKDEWRSDTGLWLRRFWTVGI